MGFRDWFRFGSKGQFPAQGSGAYGAEFGNFDLLSQLRNVLVPTRATIDLDKIEPRDSSVFQACLSSYNSAISGVNLCVKIKTADGDEEQDDHEALDILRKPNPYYSLSDLWANTNCDRWAEGNAFWRVDLSPRGLPAAIYTFPACTFRPRWDRGGASWLTGWDQLIDSVWTPVDETRTQILHFRAPEFDWRPKSLGRLSISPVRAALSDMFTDDEASSFVATVLSNLGMPGAIFTPTNQEISLTEDQKKAFVDAYQQSSAGGKRGRALLFDIAMNLQRVGFSPQEVDFKEIEMQAESRIAAVMNVPAAIAGLRVGMEAASQRANYVSANQQFWENGVVPLLSSYADVLTDRFLHLWPGTENMRIEFDLDEIPALQEDVNEKHKRIRDDFIANVVTRNEARIAAGYDPVEPTEGDIFYAEIAGAATDPLPADPLAATPKALDPDAIKLSDDPLMAVDIQLARELYRERADRRYRDLLEAEAV